MKTMYRYSFLTDKITPVEVIEDNSTPFIRLADGSLNNKTSSTHGFADSYGEAYKALSDNASYAVIEHARAEKNLQSRVEQVAKLAPNAR